MGLLKNIGLCHQDSKALSCTKKTLYAIAGVPAKPPMQVPVPAIRSYQLQLLNDYEARFPFLLWKVAENYMGLSSSACPALAGDLRGRRGEL